MVFWMAWAAAVLAAKPLDSTKALWSGKRKKLGNERSDRWQPLPTSFPFRVATRTGFRDLTITASCHGNPETRASSAKAASWERIIFNDQPFGHVSPLALYFFVFQSDGFRNSGQNSVKRAETKPNETECHDVFCLSDHHETRSATTDQEANWIIDPLRDDDDRRPCGGWLVMTTTLKSCSSCCCLSLWSDWPSRSSVIRTDFWEKWFLPSSLYLLSLFTIDIN